MRKIIDIDVALLPKLKLIAALENKSVKKLMEEAVSSYIDQKQRERMSTLSSSEKEDVGLLLLMQAASVENTVTENELFNI